MRIQFSCYNCIFKMLLAVSSQAFPDEARRHRTLCGLLGKLAGRNEAATPPEMAGEFFDFLAERTGIRDGYTEIKDRSTELALRLLPGLRRETELAQRPFETAVKFAIAGNIIDYGATPEFRLEDAEQAILGVKNEPVDVSACGKLQEAMDGAKRILYILDNCGEAVIDRLLLERYADKITIAVRGVPILNDITRRELAASGLKEYRCIDTGDGSPGVSFLRSAPEFIAAMRDSDIVVAKGQGNYESMDWFTDRPLFHLFRVKCPVVAGITGCATGSMQIIARNI